MAAPWEMNYGPYYESERRRREVGRRALGMPEVSPAVEAGELYGVEQARLGEKRAYMQQAITNWNNQQTIKQAKSAANQKMAGQAITGGASLALGGYRLGKEVGLWGGEEAATGTTTFNNVAGFNPSNLSEVSLTTAGEAMPESIAGGGMEAVPGLTAGTEAGESMLVGGEIGGSALPGAITEAPAIFSSGVTAGEAAASAAFEGSAALATGAIEGAAAIETGATAATVATTATLDASILSASSFIGPVGIVLGVAAIAVTTLMGNKKTVICTELHRQGLLDDKTYEADSEFGKSLPESVIIGYTIWAVHIVSLMKRSRYFTWLVAYLALPWAKEMAFRAGKRQFGHIVGRILMKLGLPVCDLIGKIDQRNKTPIPLLYEKDKGFSFMFRYS